jgi:2-polyprenyl-3-methyl-5-hydroxy-6-metoxy-1,4-benzoquinol methylase
VLKGKELMMSEKKLSYELEYVSCPLCDGSKSTVFIEDARDLLNGLEGEFNAVKCDNCGFIYTNPRPTVETIGYFYPDSAGYYQPGSPSKKKLRLKERLFNSCLSNYFNYSLSRLPKYIDGFYYFMFSHKFHHQHIPAYVEDGKLIDIGCSYGKWMKKMEGFGWSVYGLELNEKAVAYANQELGLENAKQGIIEDAEYENSFFDMVHMSMVLEHIHSPLDALGKVHRILKKNGELILSVPNITGKDAKMFMKYWYPLQLPTHLNHFSPETIALVLEKTGYRVNKIVHYSSEKDFLHSAKNSGNKRLYKTLKFSPVKNLLLKPYVKLLAARGQTGRMIVYAEKK